MLTLICSHIDMPFRSYHRLALDTWISNDDVAETASEIVVKAKPPANENDDTILVGAAGKL